MALIRRSTQGSSDQIATGAEDASGATQSQINLRLGLPAQAARPKQGAGQCRYQHT